MSQNTLPIILKQNKITRLPFFEWKENPDLVLVAKGHGLLITP